LIILICAATLVFTFLGGHFALRVQSKLYLILGFSAGAVIGLKQASPTQAANAINDLVGHFFDVRCVANCSGLVKAVQSCA
jgi:hypothetical protein